MARGPRRNPIRLITDAISHPVARGVLGSLSNEDLEYLAVAMQRGELGRLASAILTSENPVQEAKNRNDPVATVLSKLKPEHLQSLAEICPTGCSH